MGLLELLAASGRRAERNALAYVSLTGPQDEFVRFDDPEAYWVDGNALGKSFAAAWDAIHYCLGTHPYKRKRGGGPVVGLVIGYSYEQMLPLMEKLWFLAPKDRLHSSVGFEPGRGFTGKPPRLVFVDAAGRVIGRIVFATYKAGSKRIAGGQYDFVICDEPPEARVLGEVRPRVFRRRGWLRVLMTPVPGMPDITDLRERIESGRVRSQTVTLTEASCWPKGYPAPWHWQDEIDEYGATLIAAERGMRLRGELRPISEGRWVPAYDPALHMRDVKLRELVGWSLVLGIDHGTTANKQAAVLVAAKPDTAPGKRLRQPRVAFLGEYVAKTATTPEQDARGIRMLLERRGVPLDALDAIVGDVPARAAVRGVVKSNDELRRALAEEYQRPIESVKRIEVPAKGPSSVSDGAYTLNTLFHRGHAVVDTSCRQYDSSLLAFDGDPKHPLKDVWDPGRYAAIRGIGGPLARALVAHY